MLDIACRSEILEAIAHAQSVSAVLDALMSEHVDSDTGPHVQVVEWFKEKQDEVAALLDLKALFNSQSDVVCPVIQKTKPVLKTAQERLADGIILAFWH